MIFYGYSMWYLVPANQSIKSFTFGFRHYLTVKDNSSSYLC